MSTRGTSRADDGASWGVNMRLQDTVKSSKAGLGFDTNGMPFIVGPDGSTKLLDLPSLTALVSGAVAMTPVVIKIPFTAGDGAGVIQSMANPFGYDVIIDQAVLRITTQSTGASTLDIGIGADATTSNDGLFDGMSGAAAGMFTNTEDPGTNGEQSIVWGSTQFLNIAEASGDVTAIVGALYLTCYRA